MDKPDRIEQIVAEYTTRLGAILGEELESVVLYGSRARGDAEEESDIDVLCVMRTQCDCGKLIELTSDVTAEISLKHDVVLSRAFVTARDYRSRNTPFLMNVRREGVIL